MDDLSDSEERVAATATDASLTNEENVAKVSQAAFCLLISAVFFAGLSLLLHSHLHSAALLVRVISLVLGSLALLKVVNQIALLFPKKVGILIHWIHAIVFEGVAFAAVVCLRVLSFFFRFDRTVGAASGSPILLVHGYVNTASVWVYLRTCLSKGGLGPIYTLSLGKPFHSIQRHARTVAEKAEQIAKETGKTELTLIGHSMGGLVSAYYAVHLAPKGSVKKMISIATPFGGTEVARIGLGANGREMIRNSAFTTSLQAEIANHPEILFYNLGTRTDLLVVPYSSTMLEIDPARQFLFEDVGHASLLFSPRVARKLLSWLQ